MTCPNCKTKWVTFRGGTAATMALGICRTCGAGFVVDLVELIEEAKEDSKC